MTSKPRKFETDPAESMFEQRLDPLKTTVFRLDGVKFSSFVKAAGCVKPFDAEFTSWMTATLEFLMSSFRFHAGFCGSDEISLVWFAAQDRGFMARLGHEETSASSVPSEEVDRFVLPYSGRVQKLCSVLAGKASAAFIAAAVASRDAVSVTKLIPALDCRVWQVDSPAEALAALHMRQVITLKNARLMLAQHHLPHRVLQGKSSAEAARMAAAEIGIKFEDAVAERFRIGTYALWETVPKTAPDGVTTFFRKQLRLVQHFGKLEI